jgi:hypothetical protein
VPTDPRFSVAKGGFTTLASSADHHVRAIVNALRREFNTLVTRVTTAEGDIATIESDLDTVEAAYIPDTIFDAAGDTLYASAADTAQRLAIGSAGQVYTVASGVPAWAGGAVLIAEAAPTSGNIVSFSSIPASFEHLRIVGRARHDNGSAANAHRQLRIAFNGDTSSALYNGITDRVDAAGTRGLDVGASGSSGLFGFIGDVAGSFTIDIANYRGAGGATAVAIGCSRIGATASTTDWRQYQGSVHWNDGSPLTQVDVFFATDSFAATGNLISLYGLG